VLAEIAGTAPRRPRHYEIAIVALAEARGAADIR
jgi:hypothetical protein